MRADEASAGSAWLDLIQRFTTFGAAPVDAAVHWTGVIRRVRIDG